MPKARVYELAKELGVDSKTVLSKLEAMGEFVKSASSTVEPPRRRISPDPRTSRRYRFSQITSKVAEHPHLFFVKFRNILCLKSCIYFYLIPVLRFEPSDRLHIFRCFSGYRYSPQCERYPYAAVPPPGHNYPWKP